MREEIRLRLTESGVEMPEEKLQAEIDRIYREADPDISVRVRMININYGHNKKILGDCRPLGEYSWFVAKIRENNRTMEIGAAIDRAVDEMPEDFSIKSFILSNKADASSHLTSAANLVRLYAK